MSQTLICPQCHAPLPTDAGRRLSKSPATASASAGTENGSLSCFTEPVNGCRVSERSSQSADGTVWIEQGSLRLPTGQTLDFRRESSVPEIIKINERVYELKNGRVFDCRDDGLIDQLALEPETITAETLPRLGAEIRAMSPP